MTEADQDIASRDHDHTSEAGRPQAAPSHTPGPWRIEGPCSGFSAISGPAGELIFGLAAGIGEEQRSAEECEANANLIAAAPDLYEALAKILDGVEDEFDPADGVDGVVLLPLYESDIRRARAAIAKVSGGQP